MMNAHVTLYNLQITEREKCETERQRGREREERESERGFSYPLSFVQGLLQNNPHHPIQTERNVIRGRDLCDKA